MSDCSVNHISYQSPIFLNHKNIIDIQQSISIIGINKDAKYNEQKRIFEVAASVILQLRNVRYRLVEYHFHMPNEHKMYNKTYDAEIHYVFRQIDPKNHNKEYDSDDCMDICGCGKRELSNGLYKADNILVIGHVIGSQYNHGRTIHNDIIDLTQLQVKLPRYYYEYDGSLTTGDFAPVRWLVGDEPLYIPIENLVGISKPARPIQANDGRIILYAKKSGHNDM